MAERVWRWVGSVVLPGLLPLVVAFGIVRYVAEEFAWRAVLADGDAFLVAVGWSLTALYDLGVADGRPTLRGALVTMSSALLTVSAVAYACLTTLSVTGTVQTRNQARMVVPLSVAVVGLAGVTSAAAVAVSGRRTEDA